MSVTIIFKDQSELEIDYADSIQPSFPATVAEGIMEDGSDVSDGITLGRETLSFSGKISCVDRGDDVVRKGQPGRHTEDRERLLLARREKELLTVDAGIDGIYLNMAIENLSPFRESDLGDSLSFSISLKKIETARTKVTKLAPKESPVKNQFANRRSRGYIQAREATATETAQVNTLPKSFVYKGKATK